jgi:NAD(P)-dependent dehydrogenase (short-subunit alcohol dehydrogenase family)
MSAIRGLTDHTIIVCGGGAGIGAATAIRLAREGARVVVGDVNAAGA